MKRLRAWAPDLPEQMERLLNPAILRYLNSTPNPSPETLKDDLSKALTVPSVGGKTAAEDVADAVSVDGDRIFFVAYGISNCASCSKTWFGKFISRGGKFALQWSTNSVAANQAVHLALIRNGPSSTIVLYGIHWGDSHNRLDLIMYSCQAPEPKAIWALLDQPEGEVSFEGKRIVVTSDTSLTRIRPTFRRREVFELRDEHVDLIHKSISKTPE